MMVSFIKPMLKAKAEEIIESASFERSVQVFGDELLEFRRSAFESIGHKAF